MAQGLVVNRVRGDCIAGAIDVPHSNRSRRAGYGREVRVPDAQAADKVRSDVADFNRPTASQFSLNREVPLLRVRCVRARRNARIGSEIDRAVGGCAAKVRAGLSCFVDEDWSDIGIINVERANAADASQTGKPAGLRNERGGDR